MKLLAIESSGLVASIAVLEDDKLVGEFTTNFKKTHSQTLLPMLDDVVKILGISLEEIDAIAVSGGPGSFTGLRIGSATAKGLGLALDKPLIHIPTVDGIAYNLYGTEKLICPLMDARRQQVYTGLYTFEDSQFKVIKKQQAISIEELVEEINQLNQSIIFLGDGVPVYKEFIENHVKTEFSFAPPHLSYQRAGAVAALGVHYFQKGILQSAREYKPEYLRVSQAERELALKNQTKD
jgi:tRNA threonylcarbamoyladenosine biosynthesis protein TsaB